MRSSGKFFGALSQPTNSQLGISGFGMRLPIIHRSREISIHSKIFNITFYVAVLKRAVLHQRPV